LSDNPKITAAIVKRIPIKKDPIKTISILVSADHKPTLYSL